LKFSPLALYQRRFELLNQMTTNLTGIEINQVRSLRQAKVIGNEFDCSDEWNMRKVIQGVKTELLFQVFEDGQGRIARVATSCQQL